MSNSFLKKNFFGRTPKNPLEGYFKDFWLIFIILGFERTKTGQIRKVLSQISYIWMRCNIILLKKFNQTPQTPPGGPGGRNLWNFCQVWTFFNIF